MQCGRRTFIINKIAQMIDAANTSETSVNFYQSTRRNSPEDGHLLILYLFYNILA
jgi:hypothetical protein